ncbi:MAG: DUF4135 domain-containing protein [Bacteroidales bacterium]
MSEAITPLTLAGQSDLAVSPPDFPGLNAASVTRLYAGDLRQIVFPSASLRQTLCWGEEGIGSETTLNEVARIRAEKLERFLQRAATIAVPFAGTSPLRFEALAGDSHHGACRPLLFHFPERSMVLKFTDPRPYQLLAQVLDHLSDAIGVDLKMPSIVSDPDNEWYFVPFIEGRRSVAYDVDRYMFSMGALTAVAYGLHMSDLHLENVVVDGEKPVIIDPEFILANFDSGDPAARLRNTGFLSHNVHFSALRGGDIAKKPMFTLDVHRRADGGIEYAKQVEGFRNRVRDVGSLDLADPAKFRDIVVAGFEVAYAWMVGNRDVLCDIIGQMVTDDFRIRFLYRKTRQYAAVIHMLNLPCLYAPDIWELGIFQRFKASGSFAPRPSRRALKAEWADLLARDVPYFWMNAGDTKIRHRTGPVQNWRLSECPRTLAIRSIQELRQADVRSHIAVLNEFFDISLTKKAVTDVAVNR